ncbi:MFS transporter [Noviherbaspirillum pedocola]|uniref:MFS transporter n=1 Tax=Noviherbaspirillum pedocola TaxID=2801341 RepID=A0A934WA98_9BURK|nr:MFS transporter [Noviherbaspirillum pedocola]MBK4738354.1 MFS transporter [Noviherbaspirillum pedocola]
MNRNKAALGMFVILLLSYVVNAMDRQLFSVLAPDVRKALGLTLPQVGLAATVFTLGMGLAGIPTGYLLSRMSRRSVVILGLVIFSAATYLTAYASGMPELLVYRFISGLGEAMQLTALLAIGTTYFLDHRAVAASSLNFTFGIGAVIGPNLGAAILGATRWQTPFIVFGLLGVVALVLIFLFVKPWFTEVRADDQPAAQAAEEGVAETIWARTPMTLALATVFAGLAIYGYLGLYPTYLREALGFTPKEAGLAVSFYGFGALLSLFGGWLGDRYDYRRLLVLSLVVSAISGGILFAGLGKSLAMHILFSFVFGGAISGMVYANLSAGIIKSVMRAKASYASGLFVASLYIPAAFAGYLLGTLKESFGWSTAGVVQVAGCACIAALLSLAAAAGQRRKMAYA